MTWLERLERALLLEVRRAERLLRCLERWLEARLQHRYPRTVAVTLKG